MPTKFRPIGHQDRLSVVDHLDELRGRLIFCAISLFVVFCLCFWQNAHLLNLLNHALPRDTNGAIVNQDKQDRIQENFYRTTATAEQAKCLSERSTPGVASVVASADCTQARAAATAARQLPAAIASESSKPLTIGVGESFTQSLTVAAYFALLITAPLLLYQIYAFILPAMRPSERRVALPAMIAAPILFAVGVVFTYFEILPPAVHFLQGYNSKQFLILVQAGSYYKFEVLLMAGIGLAFEIPLILLALQRLGVISSSFLSGNWRYALVIIAVLVAALPGVDPVTMTAETVPLLALFLASIGLLKLAERRDRKAAAAAALRAAEEAEAEARAAQGAEAIDDETRELTT